MYCYNHILFIKYSKKYNNSLKRLYSQTFVLKHNSIAPIEMEKPCEGLLYFFLGEKSDQRKLFFGLRKKYNKTNKLGMKSGISF